MNPPFRMTRDAKTEEEEEEKVGEFGGEEGGEPGIQGGMGGMEVRGDGRCRMANEQADNGEIAPPHR
jgi:hypothetical protein